MARITTPELAHAFIDEQLAIVSPMRGIDRVLLNLTPKPIGMIEWE